MKDKKSLREKMVKKNIKVEENILSENDLLAAEIRKKLKQQGVFSINVMASPGAGKTSLILETIRRLKHKFGVGVIVGDVVPVDVERIGREAVPVVLANTGGACHLDAVMVEKAMGKLELEKIDLLIVENVGNLICPMNFAIGADLNVVIASVPEGDDKPEKYPGMFAGADVVLLNKSDFLVLVEFDLDRFSQGINKVGSDIKIIPVSCKTGKNLNQWIDWLEKKMLESKGLS